MHPSTGTLTGFKSLLKKVSLSARALFRVLLKSGAMQLVGDVAEPVTPHSYSEKYLLLFL